MPTHAIAKKTITPATRKKMSLAARRRHRPHGKTNGAGELRTLTLDDARKELRAATTILDALTPLGPRSRRNVVAMIFSRSDDTLS